MGVAKESKGYHAQQREILGDVVAITGTGYPIREKPPIILKECAKCHDLVDRETLFAGVCRRCPPPKVITDGR